MRKLALALLLALLIPPVLSAPPAEKEPGKSPEIPALHRAVGQIFDKVLDAREGLRLGMPAGKVGPAVPNALAMVGEFFLPLKKSPFAPDGEWKGFVSVFPPEDGKEPLDEIRIFLLTGPYDQAALVRHLAVKVKARGGVLEKDDEDPDLYRTTTSLEGDRDVWAGLGREMIVFDFDAY